MKLIISPEEFGKRVKEQRNKHGWSQEALARVALGRENGKNVISQIENAKRKVTMNVVAQITTALKFSRAELEKMIDYELPELTQDRFSIDADLQELMSIEKSIRFQNLLLDGRQARAPECRLLLRKRDDLIERLEGELLKHSEPWIYAPSLTKLLATSHWNSGAEFLFKLDFLDLANIIIAALPEDPPEDVVILNLKLAEVLRANGDELKAQTHFAKIAPFVEKLQSDKGREISLYYAEDFMTVGGPTPEHFFDQIHGPKENQRIKKSMLWRCYACRVLRRSNPQEAYVALEKAKYEISSITSKSFEATYNQLYTAAISLMLDWEQGELKDDEVCTKAEQLTVKVKSELVEERPLIAILQYLQLKVLTKRSGSGEPEDRKRARLSLALAIHNHLKVSVSSFCLENLDMARDLANTTIIEVTGTPPL